MAQYDLVVIGAGPGGYVAAIRASQLGMKTAIVEREWLGGVCLNVGCIPTKALLHSAELLDQARDGKRFGVVIDDVTFDIKGAMGHKQKVVEGQRKGVEFLMRKNKIDVLRGTGKVAGRGRVSVSGPEGEQTVETKNILIATGSKPKSLPGIQIDEERIISSTGALELKEVPRTLGVIGASAVGVEFASMYRSFGSEVTIIEVQPRLVPFEDEEISAELEKAFKRRGIKSFTGAKVNGTERIDGGIVVRLTDKDGKEQTLEFEKLLLGVGREPLSKGIGLEELGVNLDQRGFIVVDQYMRTNVEGIYAIGDVVPSPLLAHVASAEGILAVEHMAGLDVHPINYDLVPGCTYCYPEIASIGLTEARARERGYEVKTSKFPFSANGRANIAGERNGFIKLVADAKYGQLLGVHMIGPHVTELIAEGGVALSHEATAESLVHTIHAHPTLYEAIHEAVHGLVGGTIHM